MLPNDPIDVLGMQMRAVQMAQDAEKKKLKDRQQGYQQQAAAKLAQAQAAREADLTKGRARGQELFADKSLGRVDQDRSAEVADIVARRKANLAGFTPEEMNAMQSNQVQSINQANQGQNRALMAAQARSGVRGAAAIAQQQQALKAQSAQRADLERNLFLENMNQKRSALGEAERSIGGARADELARQQFNLAQMGKEKAAQLSTELGYGQLGAGERSAVMQSMAAQEGGDTQRDIAEKMKGKK